MPPLVLQLLYLALELDVLSLEGFGFSDEVRCPLPLLQAALGSRYLVSFAAAPTTLLVLGCQLKMNRS